MYAFNPFYLALPLGSPCMHSFRIIVKEHPALRPPYRTLVARPIHIPPSSSHPSVPIPNAVLRRPRGCILKPSYRPPCQTHNLSASSSIARIRKLSKLASSCVASEAEGRVGNTHICFPPKISRCCTGGMPSFSSTRSFMRETCSCHIVSANFSGSMLEALCGLALLVGSLIWGVEGGGVPCIQARYQVRSLCPLGCVLYTALLAAAKGIVGWGAADLMFMIFSRCEL